MPDTRRSSRCVMVAGIIVIVSACTTIGPVYQPSNPELPAAYHAQVPDLFKHPSPSGPWWTMFDDTLLNVLVCRGINENLDLQIATSRMRQARAQARQQVAGTGPQLDGSIETKAQEQLEGKDDDDGSVLTGALTGVWEIDLFGRLQRTREAAWARAGVQQALEQEARRLTVAEIVRIYVLLRASQRRLELIRKSIALQSKTLNLVDNRVRAGLSPGLDLVRSRAAVARLKAEVGPLKTEIHVARNSLALLLGEMPGTFDSALKVQQTYIPRSLAGPALGVPADLLRRRPDIQAAEFRIAAATAEVGVAMTDLYPRLSLPGTISVSWDSIDEDSLVRSVIAELAALLELPLYDGGGRRAGIDLAQELLVEQALTYRKQLLVAVNEVESALIGYSGALSRRDALSEAVRNNRLAFEQSDELYRQGFINFLDVLDSQRVWNITLQELASAETDLTLQVVNIFTALGIQDENSGCVPKLN